VLGGNNRHNIFRVDWFGDDLRMIRKSCGEGNFNLAVEDHLFYCLRVACSERGMHSRVALDE